MRARAASHRLASHCLRWALVAVSALASMARAEDSPFDSLMLAPGAYHVPGHQAVWGPEFHGHVANTGFVVGSRCIAVIDTGGSASDGRSLLATVRRQSSLPVCYVINTHPHPDHVMGNSVFAEANAGGSAPAPVFVGHHRLPASLAARAPFYLNALQRDFEAIDQTRAIPAATLTVADRLELDLGDRVLELHAWPTAHTDSDLTVLDRRSGTLWLGDLVFIGHLPVLDGKLQGWLKVLKQLHDEPATRLVPGHGPVLTPGAAAFEPTERYLQRLNADVEAALDAGLTLSQTVERLGSGPAASPDGWLLTDAFHRRNITAAYAELEWAK